MTINQRLKEYLTNNNISFADLSRGTNIHSSIISKWFQQNTNPSADKIAPICAYLGISEHYLLTGEKETADNQLTSQEKAFITNFRLLNHVQKDVILQMIYSYNPNTKIESLEKMG